MLTINLLPWREQARRKQHQELRFLFMISLFLACTVIGFLYGGLQYAIVKENKRIINWQHQFANIENSVNLAKTLSRQIREDQNALRFIQQMEKNKNQLFIFLNKVVTAPADMAFSEVKRQEGKIMIIGRSRSTQSLTQFVSTIPHAELCDVKNIAPSNQLQFQVMQHEEIIQST